MKHNRILISMVALIVAAFAVVTLISSIGGRRDSIADILPADTLAYLSIQNTESITKAAEESDIMETLADHFADKGEGSEQFEAVRDFLRNVRSLHLSMHGLVMGSEEPILLLAAETNASKVIDSLPPTLRGALQDYGTSGEIKLYRVDDPDPFEQILIAGNGGRLFMCNDRRTLETVLSIEQGNQAETLAACSRYRFFTSRVRNPQVALYGSVGDFLDMIEGTLSRRRDLDEFRFVTNITGLKAISSGYLTLEGDRSLQILLKADTSFLGYSLVDQSHSMRRLPNYVPEDTLFFGSYGTNDGAKGWDALQAHLYSALAAAREFDSRSEFDEELRSAELETGLEFEEIAELIDGEIGLFVYGNELVILGFAKDTGRAHRIAEQFCRDLRVESHEHRGVTVYAAHRRRWTHMAWAFMDDIMLLSEDVGTIEAAIDAHLQNRSLAESAAYQSLDSLLPSANIAMVFWNLGRAFDTEGRRSWNQPPPAIKNLIEDQAIGFALTDEGGALSIRVATDKPLDFESFFADLSSELKIKPYENEITSALGIIRSAQRIHRVEFGTYTDQMEALDVRESDFRDMNYISMNDLEIISGDRDGFVAQWSGDIEGYDYIKIQMDERGEITKYPEK